jgi:hypothetical protein
MGGWIVSLDPEEVSEDRVELALNDPDDSGLSIGSTQGDSGGLNWGTAELTQFMSQQGQWGNAPADYVVPNRTITIPIGIGMSISPDAPDPETALRNLSMKVALIQREGGQLKRQRLNFDGTWGPKLYADIVDAQLEVPDDWMETAGVEPGITLTLEATPDFYGDELELDQIFCTGFCTGVLTSGGVPAVVEGDYPARCRIVVTPAALAGAGGNGAYYGLRSRYYSSAATNSLVLTGNEDLVTKTNSQFPHVAESTDGATITVYADGSGASNNTHAGSYRALARVMTNTADAQIYLQWGGIFSPSSSNTAATVPTASEWFFVDLGVVMLNAPPADLFSTWEGSLSPVGDAATWWCDYVFLAPVAEGGAYIAYDGQPVVWPGGYMELRTDGVYNNGVTSDNYGFQLIGGVLGDFPRLPVSGLEGRPVELFVKIVNADPDTGYDPTVETFTVTPFYRPCYLGRI